MNKPKICLMTEPFSHPGCFSDVSCINLDGSLNEARLHYFADVALACGANMFRMLPCLMDDPVLPWLPGAPARESVDYNYTPWQYDEKLYAWDLSKLNDLYFKNLYRICHILNEKGIALIFSMYDRCHWDQIKRISHSPWLINANVNMISTFWNTEATSYNELYENKVLATLKGKNVYYELVNEPRKSDLNLLTTFTGRLHQKLLRFGIPQNRIISGVEYMLNTGNGYMVSDVYVNWRFRLQFEDSKEGGKKDSEIGFKTIHNFMDCFSNRHVMDTQVHSGKYFMSTDGDITTEKELYKTLMIFFNRKEPKLNQSPRFIFEFLYQGVDRKTGKQTELYGCRAFARAFHDYFYPDEKPWYQEKITLVDPGNPAYPPVIPPVVVPPDIPDLPEPPIEKPKPPKKFKIKLSWRWYVGIGVMIAAGLMVALAKPWYIREIGVVMAFLAPFLRIVRK